MQEEDKIQNKKNNNENLICASAYIIFFLPMILIPTSKVGKFHANQGLILIAVFFAGNIILGMIPLLGWALLPFWSLAAIVFMILGIVNAINCKQVELPVIGKLFNVIK